MQTAYYLMPDGSVASLAVSDGATPILPEGAVPISQVEYSETVETIKAALDTASAQLQAEELAMKQADYDALILLGMPPATASRMSGWTPNAGA